MNVVNNFSYASWPGVGPGGKMHNQDSLGLPHILGSRISPSSPDSEPHDIFFSGWCPAPATFSIYSPLLPFPSLPSPLLSSPQLDLPPCLLQSIFFSVINSATMAQQYPLLEKKKTFTRIFSLPFIILPYTLILLPINPTIIVLNPVSFL